MLCGCEGELSREYISRKYFTFRTVCVKTIDISSEGETVVPKRIVSINKWKKRNFTLIFVSDWNIEQYNQINLTRR